MDNLLKTTLIGLFFGTTIGGIIAMNLSIKNKLWIKLKNIIYNIIKNNIVN